MSGSEHDPWWGDIDADDGAASAVATAPSSSAIATAATTPGARRARRRARPRSGRRRTGIGWLLLGVLVAPLDRVRRLVRTNQRVRRALARLAIVAAIVAVLACSVGVILINNVVIGRTAELGRLEDQRRELRRDNAVLGAQTARLKVPGLVYQRATKELGMVPTEDVPEFVYLFDGSRELTAVQRRRIAVAAERRAAALERRRTQAGAAPATATANPSATKGTTP